MVIISVLLDSDRVFSQTLVDWTPQTRIPGIQNRTSPPILLADQNRTVHALFSQYLNVDDEHSSVGIYYNQWTRQLGWTKTMNILLSPIAGDAWVTDARLDQHGVIHLTFFAGNDLAASIYYTHAPANRAGLASAWADPVIIGEDATTRDAAFVIDANNNMYMLYSGNQDGNGVYFIVSRDGGMRWSEPTPIFLTGDDESLLTFGLRMEQSDGGWIHAVWGVYDISGQGRSIKYARYNIREGRWYETVSLENVESGLGTALPTILAFRENIFVFYYAPKILFRRSTDYGETWLDPANPFPSHGGVNGSLSLVIDGADTVHFFMGQRIPGSPDTHGMWHSIWNGENWSIPEAVISGPRVMSGDNNSFDPFDARAVVSQGNVILVTWRTDPGNGIENETGVWYSYIDLGIPENPVQADATATSLIQRNQSSQNVSITLSPDTSQEAAERVDLGGIQAPSGASWDPFAVLSISIAPVMIMIFVFAGILWIRRSREH